MDDELEQLLALKQFALPESAKTPVVLSGLNALTEHHRQRCEAYRRILDAAFSDRLAAADIPGVPYLPVSLFKWIALKSVPNEDVFKVMTSSGTTGQVPSRIYLDVDTARAQTRALSSIVTHYAGPKRLPMLIIDHPGVVKDRRQLNARGAGILGMASFGRDHHYALTDEMSLDRRALVEWLERHSGEDILVFGFTFMIWLHLVRELGDSEIDLSRALLIHSGGWKRLADMSVTNEAFKQTLNQRLGLSRVHNFYGMIEQVGSVFFECEAGFFHPPNFAEVVIRDPETWKAAAIGQPGVIEVLSLLPRSYPGHAVLTEDLGEIHGVDDCPCGRMGSRFSVFGRVPKAEIRGCSDVAALGN